MRGLKDRDRTDQYSEERGLKTSSPFSRGSGRDKERSRRRVAELKRLIHAGGGGDLTTANLLHASRKECAGFPRLRDRTADALAQNSGGVGRGHENHYSKSRRTRGVPTAPTKPLRGRGEGTEFFLRRAVNKGRNWGGAAKLLDKTVRGQDGRNIKRLERKQWNLSRGTENDGRQSMGSRRGKRLGWRGTKKHKTSVCKTARIRKWREGGRGDLR